MKYLYLILFYSTLSFAQVGIGIVAPNATLDVTSTTDGLLIPRVALTSLVTQAPVTASNSELVYNTNTVTVPITVQGLNNSVSPGYFYWTSSPARWNRLDSTVKSGIPAFSVPVVPNVNIPGAAGTPVVQTPNTTTEAFGLTGAVTITRTITVTGFVGNTGNVTCNVQFGQNSFNPDVDIYLTSPTGQVIELSTDNGLDGVAANNITFSDAGATNVTTWPTISLVGTFRPEGSLTADVIAPNITTMAGFNGVSPNGVWTLTMRDDANIDETTFNSFNLTISPPPSPALYRLVAQSNLSYKAANNVVVSSTYSANTVDNEGFVTVITRVNPAPAVPVALGITAATPTGTVVSYVSDSPRQGAGNFWASSSNQAVINSGVLTDGTAYTFQLWVKANVETPVVSNEQFSLIPMMIPQ